MFIKKLIEFIMRNVTHFISWEWLNFKPKKKLKILTVAS